MECLIIHDDKVNRFEFLESGQIAYLQYEETLGVINILHIYVPFQFEGRGIASSLMKSALSFADSNNLRIKPTCPFAKAYFERNTQYKNLLA